MVNLVEFEHVVAVLDRIAGQSIVNRSLREAELSRKVLAAEPGFVPYAIEAVFLEAVARALGERHLGARLGLAFDYSGYRSYAQYLLGARHLSDAIMRARHALLAEPDISIDEVARSLGYCETNSFRRAFRKWTGLPLGTYRPRLLDKASVPD